MINLVAASVIIAGLFILPGAAFAEETCTFENGEARWSIKTSVPDGALDGAAVQVELSDLIQLQNPRLSKKQKEALQDVRWSEPIKIGAGDSPFHEGDIISVTGFLYRVRCQKDGDFHLEIGTASDREQADCLIVEVPDPEQVGDTGLKAHVEAVRQNLKQVPASIFHSRPTDAPVPVQITGQLFLDATHIGNGAPGGGRGTNGCATNVWEIHPITDVQELQ